MTEVKLGLAMIARNGEEFLSETIEPVLPYVDEVAIVLGGVSTDSTPELAKKYATCPVLQCDHYDSETGRLTNFSAARNLSFKLLEDAGCQFAFVVDVEERWLGLENIRPFVASIDQAECDAGMVLLHQKDGGRFEQLRFYRLGSGKWFAACHNYFQFDDGVGRTLKTDRIVCYTDRATAHDRREQNIAIAKQWLEDNEDHPWVLFHLANDIMGRYGPEAYEEALDYLKRYFLAYEETEGYLHLEEKAEAFYLRAGLFILTHRPADALQMCVLSLATYPTSKAWATAAEAAFNISRGASDRRELNELVEFCARRTLSLGEPRSMYWSSASVTNASACLMLALSFIDRQRPRDALGALDMGLRFADEGTKTREELLKLRARVTAALGVLEQ